MTARDNRVAVRANRVTRQPEDGSSLRGIFGALERLGYDVDSMIEPFGITRVQVEDKDSCIASGVCEAVLARAMQQRRVRNLPLRVAQNTPVGANPLLDYLVVSSETVGDGLQRLSRFIHLANPSTSLDIRVQKNLVRVIVQTPTDEFRVELTVALSILRMFRETGDRLQVMQVCFRHRPEDVSEFSQVLRCPVQTGASWNGWVLTPEALRLPFIHSDSALRNWLEQKAEQILARQPGGRGVALEVRRLLTTWMAGGDMSLQAVARRMATTPRTLQRRLAEEGTDYGTLREVTRKEAAETYLADATLSIGEVAFLLGYSEPGAFHRAFRRWHKSTPQMFRLSVSQPSLPKIS